MRVRARDHPGSHLGLGLVDWKGEDLFPRFLVLMSRRGVWYLVLLRRVLHSRLQARVWGFITMSTYPHTKQLELHALYNIPPPDVRLRCLLTVTWNAASQLTGFRASARG